MLMSLTYSIAVFDSRVVHKKKTTLHPKTQGSGFYILLLWQTLLIVLFIKDHIWIIFATSDL